MNYFIEALYSVYPQVVITRGTEAFDVDGNQVQYDPVLVQEEADKQSCVSQAKAILNATDWTQANDCPLVNKADFTAYRAIVRAFAINPVANAVFPEMPDEQWN
jgi:hypothetical protein